MMVFQIACNAADVLVDFLRGFKYAMVDALEDVDACIGFDFPRGVDKATGERSEFGGDEVEDFENGVDVHAAKNMVQYKCAIAYCAVSLALRSNPLFCINSNNSI